MLHMNRVLYNELDPDGGDAGGAGELPMDDVAEAPEPYLRDLTEDQVYERLQEAAQYPGQMRGLESRLYGRFGPIVEKLNALEKAQGSRVHFDASKIEEALKKYDPAGELASSLVPALQEALQVNPLDETSLRPFIDPVKENLQSYVGEQVVLANYSQQEIEDIVPQADPNGVWNAQTQRQKDFVDWYAQQGYEVQQSLTTLGAPYVQALRRFERWEKDRIKEREKASGAKSNRLAGAQQPSSQGRRPAVVRLETEEDGFNSVFKE